MRDRSSMVAELFRLWSTDMRTEEIAMALGITRGKLSGLAHRHGLGKRSHVRRDVKMGDRVPDPTPEEIEEKCLEIRQGWSPEEYELRAAGGRKRWAAPVCSLRGLRAPL